MAFTRPGQRLMAAYLFSLIDSPCAGRYPRPVIRGGSGALRVHALPRLREDHQVPDVGRFEHQRSLLFHRTRYWPGAQVQLFVAFSQAAANAKHNQGALKTKLYVSECFADEGPRLKRARPRAQGR